MNSPLKKSADAILRVILNELPKHSPEARRELLEQTAKFATERLSAFDQNRDRAAGS